MLQPKPEGTDISLSIRIVYGIMMKCTSKKIE